MKSHSFPKSRESTCLTVKLLEQISGSVSSFRPSKSLALLASMNEESDYDQQYAPPTAEIDIVISGGALKGYFMCGCSWVLLGELKKQRIHIARVAGASAGAWAGMFMLCDFKTELWLETYHSLKEKPDKYIHTVYEEIRAWVKSGMAEDAYKRCHGRLHISITILTMTGPKNMIVSDFTSNDDMIDACFASSCIPFLTEQSGLRRYRGHLVCDGGITNNCPVFPDGIRRQLVFRLFDVEYPQRLLINAVDSCVDALVVRGALQMSRFLQGERVDAIAWLEKKEKKTDLYMQPNHYARLILAPVMIASVMFMRGTGLADVYKFAADMIGQHHHQVLAVIPFNNAVREFGTGEPVKYLAGVLLASVIDLLRHLNLLL